MCCLNALECLFVKIELWTRYEKTKNLHDGFKKFSSETAISVKSRIIVLMLTLLIFHFEQSNCDGQGLNTIAAPTYDFLTFVGAAFNLYSHPFLTEVDHSTRALSVRL